MRHKLLISAVFVCAIARADGLFTIAPDANFNPTVLYNLSTSSSVFTLGDGSVAFGGLTVNPATGTFYAIGNDSFGNSFLESFNLGGAGTLTDIGTLGTGFTSGMVYDPLDGNLYALQNDFVNTGNTYIDQITTAGVVNQLFSIGFDFEGFQTGGIAFDPINGLFYVLGADSNGVSREFDSVSLSGAVTLLSTLGDGSINFNGGLYYDPSSDLLSVIGNDSSGDSSLTLLSTDGSIVPASGGSQITGLNNVSLTSFSASTPEPGTAVLTGGSVLLIGLAALRRRALLSKGKLK
jgi:hypothetical protein